MHSCPKPNGVLEEWCIFNPDRTDHIEIVDGPGREDGLQYWQLGPQGRKLAVEAATGTGWFDGIDKTEVKAVVEEWRLKQQATAEAMNTRIQQRIADNTAGNR